MPRGAPRLRAKDGKFNLVGGRVRDLRGRSGLSQDALCARLAAETDGEWNPDRREIYKVEEGVRSVHDTELVALARTLGCTVQHLLFGNGPDS
jgi:transcriptional regulator with XRE-family HTH domain